MSSVEFPKEWCLTNLGIIVELKYGRSLTASKRDGGKFPVYGSNGVVGGHSELLVEKEGIIVVVGRKGSCREELLSNYLFETINEAQIYSTKWLWSYNNERPHSAIGSVPPCQL